MLKWFDANGAVSLRLHGNDKQTMKLNGEHQMDPEISEVTKKTNEQQRRLLQSGLRADEIDGVSKAMHHATLTPHTHLWVLRFLFEDLMSDHEWMLRH